MKKKYWAKKIPDSSLSEEERANHDTVKLLPNNIHNLAAQPLKKVDIQQLKKEQNYQSQKVGNLRGQWFQDEDYFELLKLLN